MVMTYDLDAQQSGGLLSVWLSPKDDNIQPSIYLEVLGCGKKYIRIWYGSLGDPTIDYEWRLHYNAICLWKL